MKNSLILILMLGSLVGCGKATETDKIADAQACLDKSTAATANECVSKVDGMTSPGSYLIRCAANLIQEGFTDGTRLVKASENLNGGDGATNSVAFLSVVSFSASSTSATNIANAATAQANCNLSQAKGLILLSSLANMATLFLGGLQVDINNPPDPQTLINNLLANVPINSDNAAAVGGAAVSMYESNCATSDSANGAFCEQIGAAIDAAGGSDAASAAIGNKIVFCYQNPTDPQCTGF